MAKLPHLITRPVYLYSRQLPYPTGMGSKVRIYSNARAYLDLGFQVEIVHLVQKNRTTNKDPQTVDLPVQVSKLELNRPSVSLWSRLAYYLGFPIRNVLTYMFPERCQIQADVQRREALTPNAIHQFEHLSIANAAIGIDGNLIWSSHDIQSDRHLIIQSMRRLKGHGYTNFKNKLKHRRLKWAERETACSCRLVLSIADHEAKELRQRWNDQRIQLLPMSWPDEIPAPRLRNWGIDGRLKLLHVGSLDELIPYYSMKFLLEEVFPQIPAWTLERIDLLVVGKLSEGDYCQEIQRLASNYPNVCLVGYQDNLLPFFGQADLQVVGSSVATGLRTRIIESFVRGLPVLSTTTAAKGIIGLAANENILLADDAQSFTSTLINLLNYPQQLQNIALNAQKTYQLNYSRKVAAARLKGFLENFL